MTNEKKQVLETILSCRIVMVYRGFNTKECLEASKVLYEAGFRIFEITLDSPNPYESIQQLNSFFGEGVVIGAGTVMNKVDVNQALDAGAQFIAAPITDPEVIQQTTSRNIVSMPGAMTPTEVNIALRSGADIIKIFPIDIVTPKFIGHIKSTLGNPTIFCSGGIHLSVVPELFDSGCDVIGVGLPSFESALKGGKDFTQLKDKAIKYVQAAKLSL